MNSTLKATLAVTALVAALGGTATLAQEMPGPGGPMGPGMGMMPDFATLDTDGDGQVTPAEVEALAAAKFTAADADGSGGLSVEELVAMSEAARLEALTARMTERLAQIDDNVDGQVQADELAARMPQQEVMFDMVDTDNSGSISAEEFEAAKERMHQRADNRRGDEPRGWGFWNRGDGHEPRHGG